MRKGIAAAVIVMMSAGAALASVNGDSTVVASNPLNSFSQHVIASSMETASVDYFDTHSYNNELSVRYATSKGQKLVVITGIDNKEAVSVNIIDLEGKTVYEGKVNNYVSTITLNNEIAPGIYMAQIDTGNVQKTKRLVIR